MVNQPTARTNLLMSMKAGTTPTSPIPSNDMAAQAMWRREYQSNRDQAHQEGFRNAATYMQHNISQARTQQSPYMLPEKPPKIDPKTWLMMKYLTMYNNIPGVWYGRR